MLLSIIDLRADDNRDLAYFKNLLIYSVSLIDSTSYYFLTFIRFGT